MHAMLTHAQFTAAVTAAASALPSRPITPILGAILLEPHDGVFLRVSATDYETSASADIPAVIEEGSVPVAVSGRLLAQIAKLAPKRPVELTADDNVLTVQAGRSIFTLPLMAVGEYPAIPILSASDYDGRVNAQEFAAAVNYAAAAILRDDGNEIRQHLTGIQLDASAGRLQVIGTDIHRIHWSTIDFEARGDADTYHALVPAKILAVAPAMAADKDGVMLSMRQTFGVDGAGLQRTAAVIGTPYPPVAKVFTRTPVGTLDVDSAELVAALRRASAMHKNGHVRLIATDEDTLLIRKLDDGDGMTSEEIDADLAGDPSPLIINGAYLADAVGGLKQERITLTMTGAFSPVYGNLDGTMRFAVMPIRET